MQDSIYHMTKIAFYLQILNQNVMILPIRKRDVLWTSTHNVMTQFAYLIHQWIIVFNAWLYYTLRRDVI